MQNCTRYCPTKERYAYSIRCVGARLRLVSIGFVLIRSCPPHLLVGKVVLEGGVEYHIADVKLLPAFSAKLSNQGNKGGREHQVHSKNNEPPQMRTILLTQQTEKKKKTAMRKKKKHTRRLRYVKPCPTSPHNTAPQHSTQNRLYRSSSGVVSRITMPSRRRKRLVLHRMPAP